MQQRLKHGGFSALPAVPLPVVAHEKPLDHETREISESRESKARLSRFAVIASFREFRDPNASPFPAKRPAQQRLKQMLRLPFRFPLLRAQTLKLLDDARLLQLPCAHF